MNTGVGHSNRQSLVSFVKSEGNKTPEWQKNVALATNAGGAAAGPAAIYMAVRQARSKQGGMPRAVVEAAEAKSKPVTRTGRAARATGRVLRNPKAIAAGGAVAIGAQLANTSGDVIAARFIAEDKKRTKKEKVVNKSIEQSLMSKAETNPVTGMGMNLENVEKRYYDSEADRQRRLGAAAGVLGGVAVVTGAEAARRVPLKGVGRAVRAGIKGNPRIAAGLAAASGLSGVGAAASYKRGISRRNMTWQ